MIVKTLLVRTRNEMEENFVGKKIKAQEKQVLRFHFLHILVFDSYLNEIPIVF